MIKIGFFVQRRNLEITLLECSKCGKEIIDENSSYCAYCGNPFDSTKQIRTLSISAGIFLIISSVFSLVLGFIGLLNYFVAPETYAANAQYYASIGLTEADFLANYLGFLFFGILTVAVFVPGFIGGTSTLFNKNYKLSLTSTIIVFCASIASLIIIWFYGYGYSDAVLFSEIPILVFSILSTFLVIKSKREFY